MKKTLTHALLIGAVGLLAFSCKSPNDADADSSGTSTLSIDGVAKTVVPDTCYFSKDNQHPILNSVRVMFKESDASTILSSFWLSNSPMFPDLEGPVVDSTYMFGQGTTSNKFTASILSTGGPTMSGKTGSVRFTLLSPDRVKGNATVTMLQGTQEHTVVVQFDVGPNR